MKIAKHRGRGLWRVGIGMAVLTMTGTSPAGAQQASDSQYQAPTARAQRKAGNAPKVVNLNSAFSDVPGVKQVALPVNPSDPIAIVNNQAITRLQLADECVAKEGKKILDTMISRTLIEQALASKKLSVTAAEIDEEINAIAGRFGLSRDIWLRTLDKERGISPAQYAREIVYPAIAMRKLCSDRVQVTPKDMKEAFESQYGEKLRVRMILVNNQTKAMAIWEQLHLNPGGFEVMAKEQSMDSGSKALGGLLGEPITRHAHPRNVSDTAFRELVDGDPTDRDPSHKPKDGDITGVIQMGESAFIILRREELIPANKNVNPRDEHILGQLKAMIYEVKLKEEMESFFEGLIKAAAIENRLTGSIKMANEEAHPEHRVDGDVKLMGGENNGAGATRAGGAPAAASAAASVRSSRPAALSPEVADQQFRPLKPGGKPAAPAAGTAPTQQPPAAAPQAGGGQ